MTGILSLTTALKSRLCDALDVSSVPIGYAISTGFIMPDGDPLTFYATEEEGGWVLQDDGDTLPTSIAMGLDIQQGNRERLLSGILTAEGARYDPDELLIYTDPVPASKLGEAAMSFVSALIRMQDLALLSAENTRANFADDIHEALRLAIGDKFVLSDTRGGGSSQPDMVIKDRATNLNRARIFAASSDIRMLEAVINHSEMGPGDSPVVAVVDKGKGGVTQKRVDFSLNKGLPVAIYDGPNGAWMHRVTSIAENYSNAA